MSKVDAQRAMREAKYERNRARGAARQQPVAGAATAPAAVAQPPRTKPAASPEPAVEPVAVPAEGARCGHKSMNGRVCTREAAHAEKNHRYS